MSQLSYSYTYWVDTNMKKIPDMPSCFDRLFRHCKPLEGPYEKDFKEFGLAANAGGLGILIIKLTKSAICARLMKLFLWIKQLFSQLRKLLLWFCLSLPYYCSKKGLV